MQAYHNSRDAAYRFPYGAVAVGEKVALSIDVADAPGAHVSLRTWTDADGEAIHEMQPAGEGDAEGAVRYRATLTPDAEGITWYHFIVELADGRTLRYGARRGQTGGEGELVEWEPPSFQLTTFGPRLVPPAWHEAIGGFLHDEGAGHTLTDVIATLLENYPLAPFRGDLPWRREANEPGTPISPPYFIVNDDVFGFWRYNEGDEPICILINASLHVARDIAVPMPEEDVTELISGYYARIVDADETHAFDSTPPCPDRDAERDASRDGFFAHVHLEPLGAVVLHFHAYERLQRRIEPGLGVLAHITSLPAPEAHEEPQPHASAPDELPQQPSPAPGEPPQPSPVIPSGAPQARSRGIPAKRLPENAGTLGAPASVFVDWLVQAGARYWQVLPVNPTDEFGSPYAGISAFAGNVRLLEDASPEASKRLAHAHADDYQAFCEREADWLDPYAAFMAIRQKLGTQTTWQEWPEEYRHHDPEAVANDPDLTRFAEAHRQAQFSFERQWSDLRAYANERGVQIIGDMPIYVSADSADVWANPGLFQLEADGRPVAVAGCPPDAFAADGQLWGNPLYDWDAMREQGYAWWMRRLERAIALYDWVRLDHFIGFARYFSIPAGEPATAGTYRPGPGAGLFRLAREKFGPLPVVAEDLGLLTPSIRALGASCGFPGMDILQFVDGNDPLAGYAPRPEKIAYTGTHDNQTLVGYCRDRYPHLDAGETAMRLMRAVVDCEAPVRIFPLQDLLGLGDEARMNTPSVAEGNWSWRADALPEPDALPH